MKGLPGPMPDAEGAQGSFPLPVSFGWAWGVPGLCPAKARPISRSATEWIRWTWVDLGRSWVGPGGTACTPGTVQAHPGSLGACPT